MNADGPVIVVGFLDAEASLGALREGIRRANARPTARLVVLHSAPVGVTVRNGPGRAVAAQLGDPAWATVHSVVTAEGADPTRTTTIVGSLPLGDLIRRHAADAGLVLLGPHRRGFLRRDTARSIEGRLDGTIVRVDDRQPAAPTPRPQPRPTRQRAPLTGAAA